MDTRKSPTRHKPDPTAEPIRTMLQTPSTTMVFECIRAAMYSCG